MTPAEFAPRIAREFAAAAPHALAHNGWRTSNFVNSFQTERLIAALNTLVGNWGTALLPAAVNSAVLAAMLETNAGEQTARWRAMRNATAAAEKMLDELRRACNRARQQKITREITEIVAGSER